MHGAGGLSQSQFLNYAPCPMLHALCSVRFYGGRIRDDVLIRTIREGVWRGNRTDPGPRYVFKPFGPRSEAIPKVSEFLLHPGHATQPVVQS